MEPLSGGGRRIRFLKVVKTTDNLRSRHVGLARHFTLPWSPTKSGDEYKSPCPNLRRSDPDSLGGRSGGSPRLGPSKGQCPQSPQGPGDHPLHSFSGGRFPRTQEQEGRGTNKEGGGFETTEPSLCPVGGFRVESTQSLCVSVPRGWARSFWDRTEMVLHF